MFFLIEKYFFLILEIISWDLGNMVLTGLTASHENVNKSSTHQVANIANMHRKSQKREAKKCYTTSWNSNRQSPCEINRELEVLSKSFEIHI